MTSPVWYTLRMFFQVTRLLVGFHLSADPATAWSSRATPHGTLSNYIRRETLRGAPSDRLVTNTTWLYYAVALRTMANLIIWTPKDWLICLRARAGVPPLLSSQH